MICGYEEQESRNFTPALSHPTVNIAAQLARTCLSFAGEAIKPERGDGDHESRLRVHVTHHAKATSTRALLARCIFRGWLKDCQHYYISTFPSSLADFAIFLFNVYQEVFLCAVW